MSAVTVTLFVGDETLVLGEPIEMPKGATVLHYVAGDTQPDVLFRLPDVDLASFTAIWFNVNRADGSLVQLAGVIDDLATGAFHFSWGPGDLITGIHVAEIEFDAAGGTLSLPAVNPIVIEVREEIG